MNVEETVKSLMEGFKTAADIKTIYGEPMTFFGKTLIPIARVGYGLGAGEGKSPEGGGGSGAGGGGGTEPVGFLLVSEEEVRFIPLTVKEARAQPPALATIFPMAVSGIVAGLLIARRLRRRKEAPAQ
jgi:uncharacterized spore protein YtfJ